MIGLVSFFIGLIMGISSIQAIGSENEPSFRYLKSPQFKWEGGRLTGKATAIPVRELLEELSWKEGFELKIFGSLEGEINIEFDNLTVEQSIKKIMRSMDLSFVIISSGPGLSDKESSYRVSKLIVCEKGKGTPTRSVPRTRPKRPQRRVERKRPSAKEREVVPVPTDVEGEVTSPSPDEEEEAVTIPSEPSEERIARQKPRPKETKVEFHGSSDALQDYVEQLSSEGRISPQEHKMILEKIQGRGK